MTPKATQSKVEIETTKPRATPPRTRKHLLKLSRGVGDRILLGCLASCLAMISGLLVWVVTTRSRPSNGWIDAVWNLAVEEALVTVFVLSALAVLWAVAAPRWLESLLQRWAVKALFATLILAGILFWMFEFIRNR